MRHQQPGGRPASGAHHQQSSPWAGREDHRDRPPTGGGRGKAAVQRHFRPLFLRPAGEGRHQNDAVFRPHRGHGAASGGRHEPAGLLRRAAHPNRVCGYAGKQGHRGKQDPAGKRARTKIQHQFLCGKRGNAHSGGISGRNRPVYRSGAVQRKRRRRGDDDHALGQGTGIPPCVPRWL